MAGESKQILEYAVSKGFLTQEQIEECAKIQTGVETSGLHKTLIQVIVEKGYLTKNQLTQLKTELGLSIAQVGDYGILSKLGEGGMGKVYKARHLTDGKIVAIKLLSQRINDKEHIERFAREIAAGSELRHPNIVGIIDSGNEGDNYYYVMEHIEGKNLDKLIEEQGIIPEEQAIEIVTQIADALDYASKKGLVHRDIKPANIIITDDGTAKLCDFGIAKFTTGEFATLTQTGVSISTPHYASPEQAKGEKKIDIRSDLYSLGVTLFHMATGRVPFEGNEGANILLKHINKPPPNPKKINPELSDEIINIILKLMGKKPIQRYQTPEDLMRALKRVESKKASRQELAEYLKNQAAVKTMQTKVVKTITPRGGTKRFSKGPSRISTTASKGPSPVTFIAVAATILIIVVLAIIFSNNSPQKGNTKNNPTSNDAVSEIPNTPEINKLRNESNAEEVAAEDTFNEAEQLFAKGDYDLAKDKYNDIRNFYGTTEFLKAKKNTIMWQITKCDELSVKQKQKYPKGNKNEENDKRLEEEIDTKDTQASFILLNAKKGYEFGEYERTISLCNELKANYQTTATFKSEASKVEELITKSETALEGEKKAHEIYEDALQQDNLLAIKSKLNEVVELYPYTKATGKAKNKLIDISFVEAGENTDPRNRRRALKEIIAELKNLSDSYSTNAVEKANTKIAEAYINSDEWVSIIDRTNWDKIIDHNDQQHTKQYKLTGYSYNGVQMDFTANSSYSKEYSSIGLLFGDNNEFAIYVSNGMFYFMELRNNSWGFVGNSVTINFNLNQSHNITALLDDDGYLIAYFDKRLVWKSDRTGLGYLFSNGFGINVCSCNVTIEDYKIRNAKEIVVARKNEPEKRIEKQPEQIQYCWRCSGNGTIECSSCYGQGQVSGKTCYLCNGTGLNRGFQGNCSNCGGRGVVTEKCPRCKGTGQIRCSACNGTGKSKLGAVKSLDEESNNKKVIEDVDALIKNGNEYMSNGNFDKAMDEYNKAINANPNNVDAYSGRGAARYYLYKYEEAIADYNKAISLNPDYAMAYNNKADSEYELGRYKEAIRDYKKALDLDSSLKEWIQPAIDGTEYKLSNKNPIDYYNKNVENNPDNASAYYGRGYVKYCLDNYDGSVSDLEKAITLDSKWEVIRPLINMIREKAKNKPKDICNKCNGAGTICSKCEGTGKVTCNVCSGVKKIRGNCDNCGGTGHGSYPGIDCSKCKGTGRIIKDCMLCQGTGKEKCRYCKDDKYKEKCPYCNGAGKNKEIDKALDKVLGPSGNK